MIIKESNGKHNGETIYCPVNGCGGSDPCPYCDNNNICYINDPMRDCDDFAACFESWKNWEEL